MSTGSAPALEASGRAVEEGNNAVDFFDVEGVTVGVMERLMLIAFERSWRFEWRKLAKTAEGFPMTIYLIHLNVNGML